MKCKKCGFDCAQEDGDWITCPNCGELLEFDLDDEDDAEAPTEE